jgi:hypothetical protein
VHIVEGWDDGRMPRSTPHPDYIAAAVRDVMWEPLPINSDPWAVRRRFHRRFVLPRQLSSLLCLVCAASRDNSNLHSISSAHSARYRTFARTHRQFTTVLSNMSLRSWWPFIRSTLSPAPANPIGPPGPLSPALFLVANNLLHLLPIYLIKGKHPK